MLWPQGGVGRAPWLPSENSMEKGDTEKLCCEETWQTTSAEDQGWQQWEDILVGCTLSRVWQKWHAVSVVFLSQTQQDWFNHKQKHESNYSEGLFCEISEQDSKLSMSSKTRKGWESVTAKRNLKAMWYPRWDPWIGKKKDKHYVKMEEIWIKCQLLLIIMINMESSVATNVPHECKMLTGKLGVGYTGTPNYLHDFLQI